MFRLRTSSPGKIHYRVNINKNMCLGVVDIYIELIFVRDVNLMPMGKVLMVTIE